ncbi:hypothetical protein HS3_04244 [Bacillus subtilis]|nr:hypothetical protein HS3_04244 [Bacillus subtilis]
MLGLWNKESTAFSTDYLLQNFLIPSHLKGSSNVHNNGKYFPD